MSEPSSEQLLQTQSQAAAVAQLSAGSTLKAIREAKGLSLAEVSGRIKYSAVQLGYLEASDWARLPKGVPLRGLVRNYARFLDADTDAVLSLLDAELDGATQPPPTRLASVSQIDQSTELRAGGEPRHLTWAWLLLLLVLLIGVAVYAINRGWVPEQWLIFDWLKSLYS